MKKLLAIIVLGLLLPSCIVTVKPTGGIYKEIQLSPEKSRIVIFRKGGSLIGMDTPAVNIVGDETLSFYLPSFLYKKFETRHIQNYSAKT